MARAGIKFHIPQTTRLVVVVVMDVVGLVMVLDIDDLL
jgi:hypothetical protein